MDSTNYMYEISYMGYNQDNHPPRLEPVFYLNVDKIYIFNRLFGVVLEKRTEAENRVKITILHQNDGFWNVSVDCFDNAWLDDMMELLNYTKEYMSTNKLFYKDKDNCYRMK